jgi:two-component system cell cycle sensor histidine kinase/response regulator CckA
MNVVSQFPAARAYDRDLLFQAMFEGAAIGIGICRLDGGILEANPALSRMLGYSQQELAGAHARELCPELRRDISPGNSLPDERRRDERRPDERWLGELMRGERDWFEVDKLCRRKDGSEFWGHLTVSLGHDGRRHFLITMLADATERKRVEERLGQAEKMEVIGRLAGGIAHDFNNLLTGILLYCDLLIAGLKRGVVENGVLENVGLQNVGLQNVGLQNNELGNAALGSSRMEPGRLCQHVEGVRMAGEQGAALTQELLAIARKQAVEPRPVQINEVVASSKNLLRRLIGEQIELVVLLDPMLDPALDSGAGLVLADPAQLRQVVLNLVLNARDAVSQGGTITLSTRAAEFPGETSKAVFTDALPPEGDVPQGLKPAFLRELDGAAEALHPSRQNPRLPGAPAVPYPKPTYEKSSSKAGPKNRRRAVSLVVSDNGCGMDRETRARLFEPFFTTKKPGKGTGLGLAMVQRVISEAGGTIEVESEPGHGTRMAVFFPAIESLVEGPAAARTHSS